VLLRVRLWGGPTQNFVRHFNWLLAMAADTLSVSY
jgi:hypothetical protein